MGIKKVFALYVYTIDINKYLEKAEPTIKVVATG